MSEGRDMREVILVGRLGGDPEIRFTKGGKAVCDISIAVNTQQKRGNGSETVTNWHRCVLWQRLAEDAQKTLKKGSLVRVEGFQKSREFTGRDGETRTIVEIIADKFTALDSMPKSAPSNGSRLVNGGVPRAQIPADDSDITF
jgi:single-strand DNA-binding protein